MDRQRRRSGGGYRLGRARTVLARLLLFCAFAAGLALTAWSYFVTARLE